MPIGVKGNSSTFNNIRENITRSRPPKAGPEGILLSQKLAVIKQKGIPLNDGTYTFHGVIRGRPDLRYVETAVYKGDNA